MIRFWKAPVFAAVMGVGVAIAFECYVRGAGTYTRGLSLEFQRYGRMPDGFNACAILRLTNRSDRPFRYYPTDGMHSFETDGMTTVLCEFRERTGWGWRHWTPRSALLHSSLLAPRQGVTVRVPLRGSSLPRNVAVLCAEERQPDSWVRVRARRVFWWLAVTEGAYKKAWCPSELVVPAGSERIDAD
jgi:hypothetical protein